MSASNLKQKTLAGFLWRLAERFGLQAVSFIGNIILARELGEDALGTVALILAFMRITGAITSHDMAYIKNTVKNS